MGHIHLGKPPEFSPEMQKVLNDIGLELWPPTEPVPPPDPQRTKVLYMLDEYPLWAAPHPQPLQSHRDELMAKVDKWLIWTHYMQLYHIVGSIEDAIPRSLPICFGPKIMPSDTVLSVDAKESIRLAAPYWHTFSELFVDELTGSYEQVSRMLDSLQKYIIGEGLQWLSLTVNFNYKQIMEKQSGTYGWKADLINRIGANVYPDTKYQDESTPRLKQIVTDLANELKGQVGDKLKNVTFMSYNRNGLWTNHASNCAVQIWTHEAVKSWAEEYWYFNAGRDDAENMGALKIPGMMAVHDEIWSDIHA